MMDNYVTQFNEAACSVATTEMLLNTLFAMNYCKDRTIGFAQKEILDEVERNKKNEFQRK